MRGFLEEIAWRGLLHQRTAGAELDEHLRTPGRVAYAGFDPTSDSLTIGNFIPMKLLMHWQAAGHKPIVLMGGGTGLIGDPSGRSAERTLMSAEQVRANVASQKRIMERMIDFDRRNPNAAVLMNNIDWLAELKYVDLLRDVGKHFSINEMIARDSVKRRLASEQGISYTEFSYMILQAYDFLHLRKSIGCTVQLGGSDQYGNIVSGMDLIRREGLGAAFGITAPLVGRSDGKKMSKSEGTAIWLSADTTNATSPYAFYQFWLNLPDADAIPWMKLYTMLPRERIEEIEQRHRAAPEKREAQRELARDMTRAAHGEDQLRRVEAAAGALFAGDVRAIDESMLGEVFADVPHSVHDRALLAGEGASLVDLLAQTTLASSKREAREFLGSGAIAVNGEKAGADRRLTSQDLLHGGTILLRRGKKHWHATRWT